MNLQNYSNIVLKIDLKYLSAQQMVVTTYIIHSNVNYFINFFPKEKIMHISLLYLIPLLHTKQVASV